MNSNGILHLTVNPNGRINLWDTPQDAVKCKEANEVMVQLSLTRSQIATVIRAEVMAKKQSRPAYQRGNEAEYAQYLRDPIDPRD